MGSVDLRFEAPSPQHVRLLALTSLVLLGITGLIYEYHDLLSRQTVHSILPNLKNPTSLLWSPQSSSSSEFWPSFAPLLAASAPRCSPPELSGKAIAAIRKDDDSEPEMKNHIKMPDEDIESMRRSHSYLISQLTTNALPLNQYPGTRGIVTSAGGAYFPPLLISLRFLRRTGSTLPVEVFLATPDEYEPLICDTILPSLNAKCIILSNILETHILPFSFTKYQLKAFAILFSTFEELLFLDADNFPLHAPDLLFDSDAYIEKGLVLWKDYWTPTPSPLFPTIISLTKGKEILMERPTIEAGQILVDKKRHASTLLLAGYYNAFGKWFYHLMTQGGPGEGDKETFSTAALVLNIPFHTVETAPTPLGIRNDGAAVLQSFTNDSKPFFVHASWPPKLNAMHNVRDRRQWGDKEDSIELFGEDLEAVAWGFMVEMACGRELEFEDWNGRNKTGTRVCDQTKESFRKMFGVEFGG